MREEEGAARTEGASGAVLPLDLLPNSQANFNHPCAARRCRAHKRRQALTQAAATCAPPRAVRRVLI